MTIDGRFCKMPSMLSPTPVVSANSLEPTIFHETWWLEAATHGHFDVAEVVEDGRVVGRLPYLLRDRLIAKTIDLPPLTHFLGPAIVDCEGKPNKQLGYRQEVTRDLLRKLPKVASCYIKCHRDVTDVVAFQDCGFRTGVQFTHEIQPQPVESLWESVRGKARQSIRSAEASHHVIEGKNPDAFMDFYSRSYESNHGGPNWRDKNIHTALIEACLARGRGKIYEARDDKSHLAAQIFCAWDRTASYYLMTSRDPLAHRGATGLLVWEAIKDAVNRNLSFDFDGVASQGGARAAAHFTATLAPRYTALYESGPMHLCRAFKYLFAPRETHF